MKIMYVYDFESLENTDVYVFEDLENIDLYDF